MHIEPFDFAHVIASPPETNCPTFDADLMFIDQSVPAPMDTSVFQFVYSPPLELRIQSDDMAKAGTYKFKLSV